MKYISKQKLDNFIILIFTFIWKKWLINDIHSRKDKTIYDTVKIVTGWRSAYIDSYAGQRTHKIFCPKIFKWHLS